MYVAFEKFVIIRNSLFCKILIVIITFLTYYIRVLNIMYTYLYTYIHILHLSSCGWSVALCRLFMPTTLIIHAFKCLWILIGPGKCEMRVHTSTLAYIHIHIYTHIWACTSTKSVHFNGYAQSCHPLENKRNFKGVKLCLYTTWGRLLKNFSSNITSVCRHSCNIYNT